jgi:hypothetical protein
VECETCPVGFVCELGASVPRPVCGENQYRPLENSSASECAPCNAIPGIICGANPTIATLNLTAGYLRHSVATTEAYRCKADGSWSPCSGGGDAGDEGDGYCGPGYLGPRCELCDAPADSRYFDKLDVRCHDCGNVTQQVATPFCILLFLVTVAAVIRAREDRRMAAARRSSTHSPQRKTSFHTPRLKQSSRLKKLLKKIKSARKCWESAGMPFKVKALVGLVQCLAAVPSVFDVAAPNGLDGYTRWTQMMELPADLTTMIISPSCLGSYQKQILIGSCWPIVLILLSAATCVVFELVQERRKRDPTRVAPRSTLEVVGAGLQHILPMTLLITFILVPSTATRIFKTFLCDPIQYSEVVTHRCAPQSRTPTYTYTYTYTRLSAHSLASPAASSPHRVMLFSASQIFMTIYRLDAILLSTRPRGARRSS